MNKKLTKVCLVVFLTVFVLHGVVGALASEEKKDRVFYTVRAGDNLSVIAEQNNVSLHELIKANKLTKTIIYPNQVLVIPGRIPDFNLAISRGYTRDDVMYLARAIHAESRGEDFTGQIAVGAVIINRLKSGEFPNSIREIVYENNKGVYQFSPVEDGSINLEPDETAVCAAIQAMAGQDPTNGAIYFYNPEVATDKWIKTLPVIAKIGNHVFATKI